MSTNSSSSSSHHQQQPIFKLCHVEKNTNLDRTFDLTQAITIGRDQNQCDIPLPVQNTFSRVHCKLYALGRDVVVQDQSSNGTYLNGKKMEKGNPKRITSGDRISVAVPATPLGEQFTWAFFSSCDGGLTEDKNEPIWSLYFHAKNVSNNITSSHPKHHQHPSNNPSSYYVAETKDQAKQHSLSVTVNKQIVSQAEQIERDRATARNLTPHSNAAEIRQAFLGQNHGGQILAVPVDTSSSMGRKMTIVKPFHVNSRVLKHYVLEDVIGTGNFATVRKGHPIGQPEKDVAVKIVEKKRFSLMSGETDMNFTRMLRESEVLRSMSHENIIKVFDVFDEPEAFTMVMEYVRCGDLFDLICSKSHYNKLQGNINFNRDRNAAPVAINDVVPPFNETDARKLFIQLLEALLHMYSRGVVHRDLKPENILVHVPDDVVDALSHRHQNAEALQMVLPIDKITLKVTDFGLAKFCRYGEKLTTFCGTAKYCAPEVTQLQLVNQLQQRVKMLQRRRQQVEENGVGDNFGNFFANNNNSRNADADMKRELMSIDQEIKALKSNLQQLSHASSSASSSNASNSSGYNHAVDIYSLGTILHVLLVGSLPEFTNEYFQPTSSKNNNNNGAPTNKPPLVRKTVLFPDEKAKNLNRPTRFPISQDAKILIRKMLEEDPTRRITAGGILSSSWLKGFEIKGKQVFDEMKRQQNANPQFFEPTLQRSSEQHQESSSAMMMMMNSATTNDNNTVDVATRNQLHLENHLRECSFISSSSNNNNALTSMSPDQQIFSYDDMKSGGFKAKIQQSQQQQQQQNTNQASPLKNNSNDNESQQLGCSPQSDSSDDLFLDGNALDEMDENNDNSNVGANSHNQNGTTGNDDVSDNYYNQKQELQMQRVRQQIGVGPETNLQFNTRSGTAMVVSVGDGSQQNENNKNNNNQDQQDEEGDFSFMEDDQQEEEEFELVHQDDDDEGTANHTHDWMGQMRMNLMNSFQGDSVSQNNNSNQNNNNNKALYYLSVSPDAAPAGEDNNSNNNHNQNFLFNGKRNSPSRNSNNDKKNKKKLLELEESDEDDEETDIDDDDDDEVEENKELNQLQEEIQEQNEIEKRMGSPVKFQKIEEEEKTNNDNTSDSTMVSSMMKKQDSFAIPNAEDALLVEQKSPMNHNNNNNTKNTSRNSASPSVINNNTKANKTLPPTATISPKNQQNNKNEEKTVVQVVWQWQKELNEELVHKDSSWLNYSLRDTAALEKAFQKGKKRMLVLQDAENRAVSFEKSSSDKYFFQFDVAQAKLQRQVRRGYISEEGKFEFL